MLKPIATLLFAGFFFYNGIERYTTRNNYRMSATWPVVQGEVTSAQQIQASNMLLLRMGCSFPKVDFTYTVHGSVYNTDNMKLGWACPNADSNFFTEASYVPGKKINVHYDPRDPSRGVALAVSYMPTVGSMVRVFLFAGLGLVAFVIRMKRS